MPKRRLVAVAAVGATFSFGLMGLGAATSGATSQNTVLAGSHNDFATAANFKDHVDGSQSIDVLVVLKLRNADEAKAVAAAVSTPGSASYHQYLSTSQWDSTFAPSESSVASVKTWLSEHGLHVGDVPDNNLYVSASGSAAQIEKAFHTTINNYAVGGKTIRAAATDISVGSSIAGLVDGVVGIDDASAFTQPAIIRDGAAVTASPNYPPGGPYPPPAGFHNAPPCSKYSGTLLDTTDPPFGGGWPAHLPYQVCGFDPPQLRQAYGMDFALGGGIDGSGQTVAIVDAYDSPNLPKDAQLYASAVDPHHPLAASQYTDVKAPFYRDGGTDPTGNNVCDAPNWFGEQTLDVEAVHGMAPGAHITFVAASSCQDADLITAENKIVAGHLAQIVSNSWGGPEALQARGVLPAYDHITDQAMATGIGIYFSAGDQADWWSFIGVQSGDFPSSEPGVTSVGGTSLNVTAEGTSTSAALNGTAYGYETGWATGKSYLCTSTLIREQYPPCIGAKPGTWNPPAPGFLVYGTGGGASQLFTQPKWQAGIVPKSVSETYGKRPMRANPDVAADADPTTGMLIGQTQTFPDGVHWDTFRIGGTSLSCPLFAGMMALADQVAGKPHGFLNPLLYSLHGTSAFHDIVPHAKAGQIRVDFVDMLDNAQGTFRTVRTYDFQGPETSPNGFVQDLTLHTAVGWDSQTGNGTPNGWTFLTSLK